MDLMDKKILNILQNDGRVPNTGIARKLNVSEAMVRKRIDKMTKAGIMRITAATDPSKIGYPLMVVIFLRVETRYIRSAADALAKMKETYSVLICSGSAEIIFRTAFKSEKDLLKFITGPLAKVKGIISFESQFVLDIVKRKSGMNLLDED